MNQSNLIKISDLLDQATIGLELSEVDKQGFLNLYTISSLKNILELLLAKRGQDALFMKNLTQFFETELSYLDEEDKKEANTILTSESVNLFYKLLQAFSDNLPKELQDRINKNVQKIANQEEI